MNKFILIPLFLIFSCTPEKKHVHQQHQQKSVEVFYTCSMHPQIREKKPGKCPICQMNLTKIEEEVGVSKSIKRQIKKTYHCVSEPSIQSEVPGPCPIDGTPMIQTHNNEKVIGEIKLRKAQIKHFNADVFEVTTMKMSKEIRLLGNVLQSEERESNITARVEGRVEKVFVKSTGSFVKAGDPVIAYYSPKLITGGEEYILARTSYEKKKNKEFRDLYRQSEQRLLLWGIKKDQFESWYQKRKVPHSIVLYSQNSGIVEKKNAFVGKYFNEGQSFFDLTDLSQVWVEMDVYEQDSALVKLGQKVKLSFTAIPGQEFIGEIDFINPILDNKSRTLKIRTTINNDKGLLRPGMVADGSIMVSLDGTPLVIPRTAIIDTGKRKIVWIEQENEGRYKATKITTGFESAGYVEVKKGLLEGQKVVIEGNFLLDAQAQLFGGYEDFQHDH